VGFPKGDTAHPLKSSGGSVDQPLVVEGLADGVTLPVKGRPDGDELARLLREGTDFERPRDLRQIRWRGADLRGVDLSDSDLTNADLSEADLRHARLVGARLRGAHLAGARLDDAELLGADLEGAVLDRCHAPRAGFGGARLAAASLFEARLEGASFAGATLEGADLRRADLRHARFQDADLRAADAGRAVLAGAELGPVQLAGASFVEADLRGSRFLRVSGFEAATFLRADLRDADFSSAWMLRRHISDENYLDEFRGRSRFHQWLFLLWWATSDCGRSATRWAGWTALVTLMFGAIYQRLDVDYGDHGTWLSPWYFSLVTLTTLGYGDVLPASVPAQIAAMVEVVIGYVLLGGVLSIFTNKMARRAE